MSKRKIFTFYNVAPVAIEESMNTYAADGLSYNKVDFVYDYYDVDEADTGKFLNQDNVVKPEVAKTTPTTPVTQATPGPNSQYADILKTPGSLLGFMGNLSQATGQPVTILNLTTPVAPTAPISISPNLNNK